VRILGLDSLVVLGALVVLDRDAALGLLEAFYELGFLAAGVQAPFLELDLELGHLQLSPVGSTHICVNVYACVRYRRRRPWRELFLKSGSLDARSIGPVLLKGAPSSRPAHTFLRKANIAEKTIIITMQIFVRTGAYSSVAVRFGDILMPTAGEDYSPSGRPRVPCSRA